MTRPTVQEFAGIAMLAIVATALFVLPSSGQAHKNSGKPDRVETLMSAFSIDGIETVPFLSEKAR